MSLAWPLALRPGAGAETRGSVPPGRMLRWVIPGFVKVRRLPCRFLVLLLCLHPHSSHTAGTTFYMLPVWS